jgi:DNA polymerase I-like protein with 3'-5' exonuclease and polymerase domains
MEIEIGAKTYRIELWDGRIDPPSGCRLIAADTETKLIVRGESYVPATLQVCFPDHLLVVVAQGEQIQPYLQRVLELNSTAKYAFHNFPFDYTVLGGKDNTLLHQKVLDDQIIDIALRFLLSKIEAGTFLQKGQRWALDHMAKEMLGVELDKDEEIRLTFTPDMVLTERHIQYAAMDSIITADLAERLPEQPTESIQLGGSIALHRIGYDGFLVDLPMFEELQKRFEKDRVHYSTILRQFGVHAGMPGVQSIEQLLLANIEKRTGKRFPRSPKTKKICTGKQLRAFFAGERSHPYIEAYIHAAHANKLLSTYFKKEYIGVTGRMHASYQNVMITGRTSCRAPNLCFLNRG